ncbi:hypothetical protein E2C01_068949 [Portunus trituberculatus]|uniref:Uncharacterized protein n=1 Tax=Portunus trituberculatus TaxID=210409 RepID=A0A5B7HXL1_PORTR|nr:hypothetical protein [Portunus trituberculatus]
MVVVVVRAERERREDAKGKLETQHLSLTFQTRHKRRTDVAPRYRNKKGLKTSSVQRGRIKLPLKRIHSAASHSFLLSVAHPTDFITSWSEVHVL